MTTSYDAFLPEVLPYTPDCPETVAITQIRDAAIEFCEQTDFLRYEFDPITGIPGISRYDLDPPTGTAVSRVMQAYYDDSELKSATEDWLRNLYGRDWRVQTGRPQYYLRLYTGEIILCPTPDVRSFNALSLIVSLRPTRSSTACDDVLFERWAEVIASGARARLYEMRGQPFYDPQASLYFRAKFQAGVGMARLDRTRALGRPAQSMRPPRSTL